MNKVANSEKAVDYILTQIEKLEKDVVEYKYNINSIELELNTVCDKIVEIENNGDKTQDIFSSTKNNEFKEKERNTLVEKKKKLESILNNKNEDLKNVINKINEMKEVININDEKDDKVVDNNNENSEILWILEEDRQRISRDIHDTVVQNLTALIHKEEFINQILDKDVNRAKIEINNAKSLIKDSIKDLRNIIYQLRPMELDDLGFNEALLNLVDKLDDNYDDIIVHATVDCTDDMSQIVCISSLRIINELSSNSYKYAHCSNIYIDVCTDEEYIYIDYRDDGAGFDYNSIGKVKSNNSGYGLRMLKERVMLLKGSIEYNKENAEYMIKIPLH